MDHSVRVTPAILLSNQRSQYGNTASRGFVDRSGAGRSSPRAHVAAWATQAADSPTAPRGETELQWDGSPAAADDTHDMLPPRSVAKNLNRKFDEAAAHDDHGHAHAHGVSMRLADVQRAQDPSLALPPTTATTPPLADDPLLVRPNPGNDLADAGERSSSSAVAAATGGTADSAGVAGTGTSATPSRGLMSSPQAFLSPLGLAGAATPAPGSVRRPTTRGAGAVPPRFGGTDLPITPPATAVRATRTRTHGGGASPPPTIATPGSSTVSAASAAEAGVTPGDDLVMVAAVGPAEAVAAHPHGHVGLVVGLAATAEGVVVRKAPTMLTPETAVKPRAGTEALAEAPASTIRS
jgi:hypothetical protein